MSFLSLPYYLFMCLSLLSIFITHILKDKFSDFPLQCWLNYINLFELVLCFFTAELAHNEKVGAQRAILFLMIAVLDVRCQTVCGSFTCNLFFGHVARHQRCVVKALSSASLET